MFTKTTTTTDGYPVTSDDNNKNIEGLSGVIVQTTEALLRLRGETAAASLATQLVRRFESLDEQGVTTYLNYLLTDLGPDADALNTAIESYRTDPSQDAIADLADATESSLSLIHI